jgi:crotonobetainyl-CoA:carnitine CoA-transferase CaiB-like acyl-CoA transferase
MNTANWWEKGSLEKINDPVYEEVTICNQPWKMTRTPPRAKWLCRPIGADNQFSYGTLLGIGKKRLEELKSEGVI